jgi:hypothetical protein
MPWNGAACAHLVYGEAGAILEALALINRAYTPLERVTLLITSIFRGK